MGKWILLVVILFGLVAAACAPRVDYPTDGAVLQVFQGGGMSLPYRAADMVPKVTLWGDGRVVFVAPDGVIREGRLGRATVGRLVNAARMLFDLKEYYSAFDGTDAGYTFFSIETTQGRKSVTLPMAATLTNLANTSLLRQPLNRVRCSWGGKVLMAFCQQYRRLTPQNQHPG